MHGGITYPQDHGVVVVRTSLRAVSSAIAQRARPGQCPVAFRQPEGVGALVDVRRAGALALRRQEVWVHLGEGCRHDVYTV